MKSSKSDPPSQSPSRRCFLKTTLGAAAGGVVIAPNIVKAETLGNKDKAGANSRIGIGFVGMLVNFAVTFTVKAFTEDAPKEIQDMVTDIHIPSGSGDAQDH